MPHKILQVGVSQRTARVLKAHARYYDMKLAAFLRLHLNEIAVRLETLEVATEAPSTEQQLELYDYAKDVQPL